MNSGFFQINGILPAAAEAARPMAKNTAVNGRTAKDGKAAITLKDCSRSMFAG